MILRMSVIRWAMLVCVGVCGLLPAAQRASAYDSTLSVRTRCGVAGPEVEAVSMHAAASGEGLPADSVGMERPRGAAMRLLQAYHDFGDVPRRGGDLSYDFPFVNEGNVPLVVTRVVTSCSCIKATFPRRPVSPGGEGVIRVTYQPIKSEPGIFHKVIQIFSNAVEGLQVITVRGCSVDEEE